MVLLLVFIVIQLMQNAIMYENSSLQNQICQFKGDVLFYKCVVFIAILIGGFLKGPSVTALLTFRLGIKPITFMDHLQFTKAFMEALHAGTFTEFCKKKNSLKLPKNETTRLPTLYAIIMILSTFSLRFADIEVIIFILTPRYCSILFDFH